MASPCEQAGSEEAFSSYDSEVGRIWRQCDFREMPSEAASVLARSAIELDLRAGQRVPDRFNDDEVAHLGRPGLVITGLIGVYATSSQRQVTLQYAGAGDVFAVPILGPTDAASGLGAVARALGDTRVLLFSPATFADLVERDLGVAGVVIHALRSALYSSISLVAENVLRPLKQRIARHLLDLAVRHGHEVVVPVSIQDIANATGTVREVVTRLLTEMRQQGLVDRTGGMLVLRDLHGLHCVASGHDVAVRDPDPTSERSQSPSERPPSKAISTGASPSGRSRAPH
jgi:CRP-like cAMP-binding protein